MLTAGSLEMYRFPEFQSFQSNLYVVFLGECKRERQFCAQHNDGTAVKAKEIVDMKLSQGNIFPNHVSFRPLLIT